MSGGYKTYQSKPIQMTTVMLQPHMVVFTHKLPQSLCCPACVSEVAKSKGGAKLLNGGTGLLFSDDKRC